jgi:methionine aminopeptidase
MESTLVYYNEAARVCGKVMTEIKNKLNTCDFPLDILELSSFGNSKILEQTNAIYKKVTDKGIASPVSISLNNCVGNFIYDYANTSNVYNKINRGDVVKIDFSVSVAGCIASICETVITDQDDKLSKVLNFLDTLPKEISKYLVSGETNDELKIMIESKCTENDVFPVENCISYEQAERGHCESCDSKYIVLNYKKYYDDDDNLIEENQCFEFEESEVYTINLTIIPTDKDEDDDDVKYIEDENTHLYRFNDLYYQLKLKSSRTFLKDAKSKHSNYKFDINDYKSNVKYRIGIRECYEKHILDPYPIIFVKTKNGNKVPVLSKKFTAIVKDGACYLLKYN